MSKLLWIAAIVGMPASINAQTPQLAPQLRGLSFLLGDWGAGQGRVAETGGTSTGQSTITEEADGGVLLRRDHTDLFDPSGKQTGSFEQIMMIYPEGGTLHADYADGTHIIHYVRAEIIAGRSVSFTSALQPNAPSFRLRYELTDPHTLAVAFQIAPPGSNDFHPIATGSLTKAR